MAASSSSSSLPISLSALPITSKRAKLQHRCCFLEPSNAIQSVCVLSASSPNSGSVIGIRNHQKRRRLRRISAAAGSEQADPIQLQSTSDQIVSSGDEGVAYVVQALLLVAFLALAILTAGVIYIGVQEFLQKRERERFEKEEAAKNKGKKKKRKVVSARAGPRGFGQKINEPDNDDLD